MILISHRGNLTGPSDYENDPRQIKAVLNMAYHCEVDFWYVDNQYYLGHDEPKYKIKRSFLEQKNLWVHCKNLAALERVPRKVNYFWHQTDDFTLTSHKYIWTFPEKTVGKKSIIVDNSKDWQTKDYQCHGVCSDYLL